MNKTLGWQSFAALLVFAALPATGTYSDAHVSMANDHIMALDEDGVPVLAQAYYYFFAS